MKFYDRINATPPENIAQKKAHIVGGGIAGLAAAVYLIQDARMPAENITVYEARRNHGGALEAFGSPEEGYVSAGAREPEPYFECMWELCSRIPSLEEPGRTVLDETVAFNKRYPIVCKVRLLPAPLLPWMSSLPASRRSRLSMSAPRLCLPIGTDHWSAEGSIETTVAMMGSPGLGLSGHRPLDPPFPFPSRDQAPERSSVSRARPRMPQSGS